MYPFKVGVVFLSIIRKSAIDVIPQTVYGRPTKRMIWLSAFSIQNTPMPTTPSKLTHFDAQGQAHMVDVGDKSATHRIAQATGFINLSAEAYAQLRAGTAHKGDVLGVARIAAIQASKQTAHLIPLCHPLALTSVAVAFRLDEALHQVHMDVTCETHGQTGVEMEALTSVSVGLLTIYDMLKAVDKTMRIGGIMLVSKQGGQSGHFINPHASHP